VRRAAFAIGLLILAPALGASFQESSGSGSLTGVVVTPDGAVLPGVAITATRVSGGAPPQTTVTDVQGRFRFVSIPAGDYRLKAELAGFGTQTASARVEPGQSAEVTIRFGPQPIAPPPTGTVEGHVQSEDGTAIDGASLVFVPGRGGKQATADTNSSGSYTRDYLIVDTYDVTCSASGHAAMTKSIRVAKDSTVRLDFKLKKQ